MKYLSILLILLLFSCATDKEEETVFEEYVQVWQISTFIQEGEDQTSFNYDNVFLTYNEESKKYYISYMLNKDAKNKLQEEWGTSYKKLELESLKILQEIKYSLKNESTNEITLDTVLTDYILSGKRTDDISKKINNIVYTRRAGNNFGAIPLLLNKKNIIDDIPTPKLNSGDSFKMTRSNGNLRLSNKDLQITARFIGRHRWIGEINL